MLFLHTASIQFLHAKYQDGHTYTASSRYTKFQCNARLIIVLVYFEFTNEHYSCVQNNNNNKNRSQIKQENDTRSMNKCDCEDEPHWSPFHQTK